ncbi:hypothetical protein JCM10212_006297 [Sporobolomyces blumeae]
MPCTLWDLMTPLYRCPRRPDPTEPPVPTPASTTPSAEGQRSLRRTRPKRAPNPWCDVEGCEYPRVCYKLRMRAERPEEFIDDEWFWAADHSGPFTPVYRYFPKNEISEYHPSPAPTPPPRLSFLGSLISRISSFRTCSNVATSHVEGGVARRVWSRIWSTFCRTSETSEDSQAAPTTAGGGDDVEAQDRDVPRAEADIKRKSWTAWWRSDIIGTERQRLIGA